MNFSWLLLFWSDVYGNKKESDGEIGNSEKMIHCTYNVDTDNLILQWQSRYDFH